MELHICKTCGSTLVRRDESTWECGYCHNTYSEEKVKSESELLRSLLDEYKTERLKNLRRNLYDAINAKYTDSDGIIRICGEIKKLLPDDFAANFYYVANSANVKQTAECINGIDVEENREYVDGIIDFMLRSFCSEYHLPLAGLIERAYRGTSLAKLEEYNTRLSDEAEAEIEGVYGTKMTRDVFVAYSSKDMKHVYKLVSVLEASGLSCFVAARNLRHGSGAVQNYNAAIREALNNCRSVVFVSSPNSRSFSCDALKLELSHVKQTDINNAPYEYKQDYVSMPSKYKKPRVELRIADSKTKSGADAVVKEFFEGCEYAYSADEVAKRVIKLLSENVTIDEPAKSPEPSAVPSISGALNIPNLLRLIDIKLEGGDFDGAKERCEDILGQDAENAQVYLRELMIELKVKTREDLSECAQPFDKSNNYYNAYRFGDDDMKAFLGGCIKQINERNEYNRKLKIYDDAKRIMNGAAHNSNYVSASSEYVKASKEFGKIPSFKDSASLRNTCMAKAKECDYKLAIYRYESATTENELADIEKLFSALSPYEQSDEYVQKCRDKAKDIIIKGVKPLTFSSDIPTLENAIEILRKVSPYGESEDYIIACTKKIVDIRERKRKEQLKEARRIKRKKILTGTFVTALVLGFIALFAYAYYQGAIKPELDRKRAEESRLAAEESSRLAEESKLLARPVDYAQAVSLMNSGDFQGAYDIFVTLSDYEDSARLADECSAALSGDYRDFIKKYNITEYSIPEGVTLIGNSAFSVCVSLTSITIPEGVTAISQSAFFGCSSLTSVTIPEGVTSIGPYAFANCRSLTSITIPEGVTSIGNNVFSGCRSLTSITIPEGVTSIEDYAFDSCTSLTSVTIPEGVTSIGKFTFYSCTKLEDITYKGTKAEWNSISKGSSWHLMCPTITVHCTDGDITVN